MTETTNPVVGGILDVFTQIGDWIGESVQTVSTMFYSDGGLTLLGSLAVCGLGISVIFLLVNTIRSFLRFR